MANLSDCGFRRTYTLVAQTPMIHFQHDQAGANLRATEVKPKLDRYLSSLLDRVPDTWRMPGQPTALHYQMRILTEERSSKLRGLSIDDCKAYFGNMGSGDKKELVFRDCQLEIHCFIPDLLAFIDRNISGFFIVHNFGTRQSKGFGGFLVAGTKPVEIRQTLEAHCPHFFYADLPRATDLLGRMNHALAVYTLLKNGTNQTRYQNGIYRFPQRYIKGYAMRAFLPAGVGSDKAFLKARVVPARTSRQNEDIQPYASYTFIRALLGLADHYEFRDDMRNGGIDPVKGKPRAVTVNIAHFEGTEIRNGKLSIPEESIRNSRGIKRFRSPILIKIFENRIYFLLDESWQIMLGQTFLMMKKGDHKAAMDMVKAKRFRDAQALFQNAKYIRTPDEFDPDAFITGFIQYFHDHRETLRAFPDRGGGSEFQPSSALTLEKGGKA